MHPLHFYHFKKSIEPKYSYIPTGDIEVNRLIRNLAYWRQAVSSTIKQNKTLILADWTAQGWPRKKRELVIEKLYELLDSGFSIHAWQSGQLEEITKDNLVEILKEPQILERISTPAMRSDLEFTAINELPHVVKDQILILDDYQINGLLNPDAFKLPRELDISELLKYEKDLEKYIPTLKNAVPPITNITDSVATEESYAFLEKIQTLLPEIPIKTHFQSITFTNDMVSQLLLHNKAAIGKRTIHLHQLQSLKDVRFNNISSENIKRLLPLLPNIKKLCLINCDLTNAFELNIETQFPLIEKIKLLNTPISGQNLHHLLSKAVNLASLIVDTDSHVSNNYSFNSLKLPNFNLIKIKHSNFSKKNLQEIIANNKLKRLVWQKGEITSNTLTEMKDADLSSIKILEIRDCVCNSKYLDDMFNVLPQLEHVILVGGTIAKFQSTFTLPSLKTLQIDVDRFNDIANAFNNIRIEKLILIDKYSSLIPNLDQINLNLLKQFQLQHNKINHSFLAKLLDKAVSLNHLDLQGCSNLQDIDKSINFANIETLNLSNTDITPQSLIAILQNAPNLKRLDLSECNNITISSEIDSLLRGIQVYYPSHIKVEKRKPLYQLIKHAGSSQDSSPTILTLPGGSSNLPQDGNSSKSGASPKESALPKTNEARSAPITPEDCFSNTKSIDAKTSNQGPPPPNQIKKDIFSLNSRCG